MDGQGQLFDPASTRERTPGEMGVQEWHDQPEVQYHATFRDDMHQAPSHHFGSLGTAAMYLDSLGKGLQHSTTARGKYFDPQWGESDDDYGEPADPEPDLVGRIHARKLNPAQFQVSDSAANAADALYRVKERGEEPWEVPGSIKDSFSPAHLRRGGNKDGSGRQALEDTFGSSDTDLPVSEIPIRTRRAYGALTRGQSVPYENLVEGDPLKPNGRGLDGSILGNISYVAPWNGQQSWDGTVTSDRNASSMKKDYARQRQLQGTAGTVALPAYIPERITQPSLDLGDRSDRNDIRVSLSHPPARHMSKQFKIPQ